jgi:hypothetical protein
MHEKSLRMHLEKMCTRWGMASHSTLAVPKSSSGKTADGSEDCRTNRNLTQVAGSGRLKRGDEHATESHGMT